MPVFFLLFIFGSRDERGCDFTHHYYYLLSWCCMVLKLTQFWTQVALSFTPRIRETTWQTGWNHWVIWIPFSANLQQLDSPTQVLLKRLL